MQSYVYWSGVEDATDTISAWYFNFYDGYQLVDFKDNQSGMPWLCAPAMWPPMCRSLRCWRWR